MRRRVSRNRTGGILNRGTRVHQNKKKYSRKRREDE